MRKKHYFVSHFPCPACGAPLRIRGSHQTLDALREQYGTCSNPHCGASYMLRTEVAKQLSPPSALFANKAKSIPVCDDFGDQLHDMAREYVARPWHGVLSRDDKINACREYLQGVVEIDDRRAELLAAHAIAGHESADVAAHWSIALDESTSSCVILNHDGQQYAISLKELAGFAEARRAALEDGRDTLQTRLL